MNLLSIGIELFSNNKKWNEADPLQFQRKGTAAEGMCDGKKEVLLGGAIQIWGSPLWVFLGWDEAHVGEFHRSKEFLFVGSNPPNRNVDAASTDLLVGRHACFAQTQLLNLQVETFFPHIGPALMQLSGRRFLSIYRTKMQNRQHVGFWTKSSHKRDQSFGSNCCSYLWTLNRW